jgi:hypothetical protein
MPPVLRDPEVGASKAVPIEVRRPRYYPSRVVIALHGCLGEQGPPFEMRVGVSFKVRRRRTKC